MLALLAAQGGTALPIEAAVEAPWPSPGGEDRKGSLEVALARLRKLLGVPGVIMLVDGGLRLDLRVVWTDVVDFEFLEKRVLSGDDRARAIESGARALLLYRGALLAGDALSAPWRVLREQFSRRFSHLVLRHDAALEARGRWGDAADAYGAASSATCLPNRSTGRSCGPGCSSASAPRRCVRSPVAGTCCRRCSAFSPAQENLGLMGTGGESRSVSQRWAKRCAGGARLPQATGHGAARTRRGRAGPVRNVARYSRLKLMTAVIAPMSAPTMTSLG